MSSKTLLKFSSLARNYCLRSYHGRNNFVTMEKVVDLRSDTVTKPSREMLEAMISADVGDDVYKEDKTVNKLEEMCAHLFGMESALFVPTGTMGNLICIMSHCKGRGEEMIIGSDQHVYCYEQGHFMQLASVSARVLPNKKDGTICLKEISDTIMDNSDFHCCETKLICVENTHMRAGGIPLSQEYLNQVGQLAKENKVSLHVDGARLYNAAVSLDCPISNLLLHADSVSMCLSKGLGCPVGSVIGGSKDFIERAKRIRKSVGGGMRQSGILAAAGIYALENAHSTLLADHIKAYRLAKGIDEFECSNMVDVDLDNVRTNIVMMKTKDGLAERIAERLVEKGILCMVFDSSTVRFVTHKNISDSEMSYVIEGIYHVISTTHSKEDIQL